MIGIEKKGGVETGQEAIVLFVEKKGVKKDVQPWVSIDNRRHDFRIDVQESPRFSAVLPTINDAEYSSHAGDTSEHRKCHSNVKGGCQVAPIGAQWVGTAGGAVTWNSDSGDARFGILSNYHVFVGGRFQIGDPVGQPVGSGKPFGYLSKFHPINFSNGTNYIDAALANCKVDGVNGYYCTPEQIGLGRINPQPVLTPKVNDTVMKTGRTTGVQKNGRVTGISVTTSVSYGEQGVARFADCVAIQNSSGGEFSAAGDSGSLILTTDLKPYALLFAGGGGTTIACRIDRVMNILGVRFF